MANDAADALGNGGVSHAGVDMAERTAASNRSARIFRPAVSLHDGQAIATAMGFPGGLNHFFRDVSHK